MKKYTNCLYFGNEKGTCWDLIELLKVPKKRECLNVAQFGFKRLVEEGSGYSLYVSEYLWNRYLIHKYSIWTYPGEVGLRHWEEIGAFLCGTLAFEFNPFTALLYNG